MNALTVIHPAQVPAFSMGEMERIALAIAKGGLFGSTDPNAVLTLCMLAQAENKHPALIMQNYHIISGKPAKKADAMLVDFLGAGGKVEWHALNDDCADATFSHPMGGSVRISWDKARVAQAQLTGNAMHKKYPRQMLRARVISEGVRTVFPGATSGLYVPEEVSEMAADQPATRAPAMPTPQRARDIKKLPPAEEFAGHEVHPAPPAIASDEGGPATSDAAAGAAPTGELPAAVQEWVDGVIGEIRACETITDLAELQAARKVETKLARYAKQRDDLVALFNDRRAVIEGGVA